MYETKKLKHIEYAALSDGNCLIGGFKVLQEQPFRQNLTVLESYKKMIFKIEVLEGNVIGLKQRLDFLRHLHENALSAKDAEIKELQNRIKDMTLTMTIIKKGM